jgi:hypothetical protein
LRIRNRRHYSTKKLPVLVTQSDEIRKTTAGHNVARRGRVVASAVHKTPHATIHVKKTSLGPCTQPCGR